MVSMLKRVREGARPPGYVSGARRYREQTWKVAIRFQRALGAVVGALVAINVEIPRISARIFPAGRDDSAHIPPLSGTKRAPER